MYYATHEGNQTRTYCALKSEGCKENRVRLAAPLAEFREAGDAYVATRSEGKTATRSGRGGVQVGARETKDSGSRDSDFEAQAATAKISQAR